MTRTILIAGADCPTITQTARALGLHPLVVCRDHRAAAADPDNRVVADITSADELVRLGRVHAIHGICAGHRDAAFATAQTARRLGLPGPAPEAVALLQDSAALRAALTTHGCLAPRTFVVSTLDEARRAALDIGLPVKMGPADSRIHRRSWRVDYVEDISLAHARAIKGASTPDVLVEAITVGPRFYVDCTVAGGVAVAGVTARITSDSPFDFDEALMAPPDLDAETHAALSTAAECAIDSTALDNGCVRVDLAMTRAGLCILGVDLWQPAGVVPTDLLARAYGVDLTAESLRMAVGDAVRLAPVPGAAWALRWLSASSGVVTGVANLEHARAVPGVRAVEVFVQPGDVVGHIVDEATRDRIGYVLATAETAAAALAAADSACDRCRIVTQPARNRA